MKYDYSDFDIEGEDKVFTFKTEDNTEKRSTCAKAFNIQGLLKGEPRLESSFAIISKCGNMLEINYLYSIDRDMEITDIENASINFMSPDDLNTDGDYFAFGIWSVASFTPNELPIICNRSIGIDQIYRTACENHLEHTVRRLIFDIKLAVRRAQEKGDPVGESDYTYLETVNGPLKSCITESDFEATKPDELGNESARRFFKKTMQFLMDRIPVTLLDRYGIYVRAVYHLAQTCNVHSSDTDIFFEKLNQWTVGVFWYDRYLEYITEVCN